MSDESFIIEYMFEYGDAPARVVEISLLPNQYLRALVPLALEAVHAGWPSAAQDYYSGEIDLNEHLIHNKAATYIVRVVGDSMVGAGISNNDELIVDRSIAPEHGHIVIAILDGELTVKRLIMTDRGVVLRAENARYPDIQISELSELRVWGVVTRCLHHVS